MNTKYMKELAAICKELVKLRDEVVEKKIRSGPEYERIAKQQRKLGERLITLRPD
jgi:hypothetical protein